MRTTSRLLGLAALFLITTGQASTDGCVPAPEAAPEQETTTAAPSVPSGDTTQTASTETGQVSPSTPSAETARIGERSEPRTGTASRGLRPGQWAGPVTGGYKGDSVSFTVSASGQQIEDVTFTGHWRCKDGSSSFSNIKRMDVGHVPGAFQVGSDGTFSEEKREPYLLWTFAGQAGGAAEASGTIRIEYAAECDTYRLQWTARPTGG
jgi:hypothetical protein